MRTIKKSNQNLYQFIIFILFIQFIINQGNTKAQHNDFPYEIKKMDYAIIPLGIVVKIGGDNWKDSNRETMSQGEIASLNRMDVNSFDRSATEKFSSSYDNVSDIIKPTLILLPSAIVGHQLIKKEWLNTLTYGVLYLEAYLYTKGLTDVVKAIARRKRPYLYNSSLSVEERYEYTKERDSYSSFFSGHTSAAFASGVCLAKTFTDIYGKSTWSKVVWGTSLTAASICGYCRYASGEHYPTDVITGALFGAAIGYVIPVLHKKSLNDKFSFSMYPGTLHFSYNF